MGAGTVKAVDGPKNEPPKLLTGETDAYNNTDVEIE
jgi:hypothetical protein